ncbi:hypothetical protein K502DRAFT_346260 [Neoconidiobolus thromboides FSU 785]|nr:hypothetical protein K502DRAFT_346260 [Neoconidiobolus thromboides FSU 785]
MFYFYNRDIYDRCFNDNNIRVVIVLSKLKEMTIATFKDEQYLGLFSEYFNQFKTFDFFGDNMCIRNVIKLLSLSILRLLRIRTSEKTNFDRLDIIKMKFNQLTILFLTFCKLNFTPIKFGPNVNFTSDLEL